MEQLTDEKTFNLAFATPYKSMSIELAVYQQGVQDGTQAQLKQDRENILQIDTDYIDMPSHIFKEKYGMADFRQALIKEAGK